MSDRERRPKRERSYSPDDRRRSSRAHDRQARRERYEEDEHLAHHNGHSDGRHRHHDEDNRDHRCEHDRRDSKPEPAVRVKPDPDGQAERPLAVQLPPPPPRQGGPSGRGEGPGRGRGPRTKRWEPSEDLSKMEWGKPGEEAPGRQDDKPEPEANFALSGKLAAESNRVNGVVLVHQEPPEARKPAQRWRLYVFKGGEPMGEPLYIHRQSCYLVGRERRVCDIATDHPSCSKQHAVLQFRLTAVQGQQAVRPYIMDLGSVNGTWLNRERLEAERYTQLLERDMLKFGNSSREYILLHDKSNAVEAADIDAFA